MGRHHGHEKVLLRQATEPGPWHSHCVPMPWSPEAAFPPLLSPEPRDKLAGFR